MTDRINATVPRTETFNIVGNGVNGFSLGTIGFPLGFNIIWEAVNYTDGDYAIEILDSDDFGATGIPLVANQLIVPELFLETSTDSFLIDSGNLPKYFGLRNLKGNGIRINITAANVTTGADIHVILLPYAALTPIRSNQV